MQLNIWIWQNLLVEFLVQSARNCYFSVFVPEQVYGKTTPTMLIHNFRENKILKMNTHPCIVFPNWQIVAIRWYPQYLHFLKTTEVILVQEIPWEFFLSVIAFPDLRAVVQEKSIAFWAMFYRMITNLATNCIIRRYDSSTVILTSCNAFAMKLCH